MRLLEIPRRTPFFGSLCFAKKSLSAIASASGSRSSPPTITPGLSGSRATWTSSADPLFETRAAASCDAPILRPTSLFAPLLFSPFTLGAFFSRFSRGGFAGFGSFRALAGFGSFTRFCLAGFSFLPPPSEISFFQNGTALAAGNGGSSAAGTGGCTTGSGSGTGTGAVTVTGM